MTQLQRRDAFESRLIVHQYTEDLPGTNDLERAVRTPPPTPWNSYNETQSRRLKELFQSTDDSDDTFYDAERERRRLLDAWSEFQDTLPELKEKKSKLMPWRRHLSSKARADDQLKNLEIVDLKDVQKTVDSCQKQWNNKDRLLGGKLMSKILKAW